MTDNRRWTVIPRTAALCWLSMGAGALLLGSSVVTLLTNDARVPVLEIVVSLAGLALIVFAVLGLVKPHLRGR
ncbi:hypothetical protein VSH64_21635 [Amycolatopsis rhabdoformis]|uniref:Uncharacterized protein n=1 Tax=Amycolatopsis rhabdoformis TaxID=1448059 RepID=A0ABZ1IJK9_9PSEU|nr:hypothetical protein [Amycolatopsis rhabdoformis]WSE34650.1 hypothetical protein VSH64_21635 [Amycolatopsis rhabdoformis]